ncbi:hypothetical protein [Flavobacterium laiguense]|uniref:Uncharacterized protein n=1 Tax=Flavobacterium laiguense TaxID=2169409 RepID=A0A2U1JMD0_9FLAO|nr:hypothetical protein [Flavobacterium laiguense]PWA06302.1 hypothetical protein DB891_15975 [Flavobacterium laiguense]
MKDQHNLYERQYAKAKETLKTLEKQKSEIDFKLDSDPICSHLHKELRTVNLDIKITLNEIEHVESHIFKCEV